MQFICAILPGQPSIHPSVYLRVNRCIFVHSHNFNSKKKGEATAAAVVTKHIIIITAEA